MIVLLSGWGNIGLLLQLFYITLLSSCHISPTRAREHISCNGINSSLLVNRSIEANYVASLLPAESNAVDIQIFMDSPPAVHSYVFLEQVKDAAGLHCSKKIVSLSLASSSMSCSIIFVTRHAYMHFAYVQGYFEAFETKVSVANCTDILNTQETPGSCPPRCTVSQYDSFAAATDDGDVPLRCAYDCTCTLSYRQWKSVCGEEDDGGTQNTLIIYPEGVLRDTLSFKDSCVDHIRKDAFSGFSELVMLVLEGNRLTQLETALFTDLVNLDNLVISNNKVSTLSPGSFDHIRSLSSLTMRNIKLNTLPVGIFDDLGMLTYLDLATNRLTSLPVNVFERLNRLEFLHIGSNMLGTFTEW